MLDLSDLVEKILLMIIIALLMGVVVLLHSLPSKIVDIMPMTCGQDRNPCQTRGIVSLDDDTMKELETRLKAPPLDIPEPCGRRNTPCFVIIEQ